ncbi:MAG: zincin-like metallopeptidase domain-containing protein [Cyanobium sp. CZS 48M]|nr:zincin-like metallopeptidase domain-containing protein [Cyanobium sp. CZS48M]
MPVSFGGDRACFLPSIDRIELPDRANFHSPAAFCATGAYEQVHSTGHESRLKRDLGGAYGKPRDVREELVAELGPVLLGGAARRSAARSKAMPPISATGLSCSRNRRCGGPFVLTGR